MEIRTATITQKTSQLSLFFASFFQKIPYWLLFATIKYLEEKAQIHKSSVFS
jgi:hypothetical protein